MAFDDKSPVAAIMMKLHGGHDGQDGEDGGEDGGAEGLHVAAEQLIHAIHAGDAVGVVHAFSAMFDMLESMPHEEAGEEEGGKEGPPPGGEE